MTYFKTAEERRESKSSAYYEFFVGEWEKGDGHWNDTSINISDEIWDELKMGRLIRSVVNSFDSCGVNKISDMQWTAIVAAASLVGGELYEAILEADKWASRCLIEHNCFTILGL